MEKNKTIKRLSAVLFAVLLIAALVLSVLTKGFTDWRFGKEQPSVNDLNNNVVVTPQESGGAMTLSRNACAGADSRNNDRGRNGLRGGNADDHGYGLSGQFRG